MNTRSMLRVMLASLATSASAEAALTSLSNLATIRVWESTGPFVAFDFPKNDARLTNRFGPGTLSSANSDFSPLAVENYDVFYSDANGTLKPSGDYLTVEAHFPIVTPQPGGGGLNLGAVDLLDAAGGLICRADVLASWHGNGTNYIPGSELLAVDSDTFPVPSTDTTMGNTAGLGPPTQLLRVTVGFSCVPEPGAACAALMAICSAAAVGMRSRLG